MDATRETTECYDRIAGRYAETWCTKRLDTQLAKFARLVGTGRRILDLGCGPGRDIHHLDEFGFETLGLDASAGMLGQARARGCTRLAQGDMRRLPFVDGAFDAVWWAASLLHLPRDEAPLAVREVRRVMRPGGPLFVAVQRGSGESWKPDADGGRRFFCLYEPRDFADLLAGCAFDSIEIIPGPDLGQRNVAWLNAYARAR